MNTEPAPKDKPRAVRRCQHCGAEFLGTANERYCTTHAAYETDFHCPRCKWNIHENAREHFSKEIIARNTPASPSPAAETQARTLGEDDRLKEGDEWSRETDPENWMPVEPKWFGQPGRKERERLHFRRPSALAQPAETASGTPRTIDDVCGAPEGTFKTMLDAGMLTEEASLRTGLAESGPLRRFYSNEPLQWWSNGTEPYYCSSEVDDRLSAQAAQHEKETVDLKLRLHAAEGFVIRGGEIIERKNTELTSLRAENERLVAERDAAVARMGITTTDPCAYCGKPCSSIAGNPAKWPMYFPEPDGTGKCQAHHTGCVLERLAQLATMRQAWQPFSILGRGVCKWLYEREGDIFGEEDSTELMELMQAAGLAIREPYDPERHGSIDADPGDEIWTYDLAIVALGVALGEGEKK